MLLTHYVCKLNDQTSSPIKKNFNLVIIKHAPLQLIFYNQSMEIRQTPLGMIGKEEKTDSHRPPPKLTIQLSA